MCVVLTRQEDAMFGYSGLSIGFEKEKKVPISQANPVQLSETTMRLRFKAYTETSASIYEYQMGYQYHYRYYLAKLARYEGLEHAVTLELCSIVPEARYRINESAGYILKCYTDEEIYYSRYPVPQNLQSSEVQIFKNYMSFLSLRRSLLESRKKIWRLYTRIETMKRIQSLWESEYYEALEQKCENDHVYNLTLSNFGRQVKDYAERLRQIRFNELKKVKESMVLGILENEHEHEFEKRYSDDDKDKDKDRSNGHLGDFCLSALKGSRRVCLYRPSKSESPKRVRDGRKSEPSDSQVESMIPDSSKVKKELTKLPPKPEEQ